MGMAEKEDPEGRAGDRERRMTTPLESLLTTKEMDQREIRKQRMWWSWLPEKQKMPKVDYHYLGLRGNSGPLYSAEDLLDDYTFQPINLDECDPSKYPERTPRKNAIPDDEMSYEDRIRMSFIRFDRLEACKKNISPYEDPHVDSGKEFLEFKFDRYYRTVDGKDHMFKCSILDRQRGYIHEPGDLPYELSYPELCVLTFYDIPLIENPTLPTIEEDFIPYDSEYTNEELAKINKIVNKKFGHTLPTTAKTIKKIRERSVDRPGFPPYCYKIFEGTPIGNLLEDHEKPGRAALHSLHNYFMMFYFEGKKYCVWPREPTRKNIVRLFQDIAPSGVKFANEDLAEKRFDLLVEYGIIKGWKGYTNQKQLLYYVTQKSGPHEIPAGPRRNTQEYYILNNK